MKSRSVNSAAIFTLLIILAAAFLFPIVMVLINSFKGRFFISTEPFSLPTGETFVGLENYISGLQRQDFSTRSDTLFLLRCFLSRL